MPEYPDKVEWSDMRVENIERSLRRVVQGVAANGKTCDLIFILLPLRNSQFYGKLLFFLNCYCVAEERAMNGINHYLLFSRSKTSQ